ncbi:hypothetical protein [Vibrio parahaemolyticus]|uniref:hypothetical protein n=1 Tax=Vibrio parahaemolyticus TaxID=670 RepID=UPI0003FC4E48|nr:hypothetical protein [Vibrio parahaemolyticus]EGQ7821972.1 hypothetical protein [Vibrio parahaemolyticus]EGR0907140.1 hypothetical protein [Vibrio parahaemolyticus]EGV3809052.1 hypothetical protein [Vibrio parahaemolyticus]EIR4239831.1 hypothetical protein [Vibrio parahaemolyticus]ELS3151376.1 hypothetical protein [Vibrio parahaemolyticus]
MTFNVRNPRKEVFKISYDMPETSEHTIDAELLGSAILSMSRTLRYSDKVLNGEESNIQVEVRAHEEGSFVIEFVTWLTTGGVDVLSTIGLTGLGASAASGTVLGVLDEIKDKKIVAKVLRSDNKVELELENGETVECDSHIADIVTDHKIRKELDQVIKAPVAGKQDAKFIVKDEEDNDLLQIDSDKAHYYKSISAKTLEEQTDETKQVTIYFSQVNFDGPSGWKCKLPDGNVVSVRMRDQAFRERVINGYEEFSKTKACVVKLTETVRTKADSSVTTNYYIEEVIRQLNS